MLLLAAVQLLLFKLLSFMAGDEHSLDVRRDGGLCTDDVPYGVCLKMRKKWFTVSFFVEIRCYYGYKLRLDLQNITKLFLNPKCFNIFKDFESNSIKNIKMIVQFI